MEKQPVFQFNEIDRKRIQVFRASGFGIGLIVKDDLGDWVFKSYEGRSLDVADMIQLCNKINELENRI